MCTEIGIQCWTEQLKSVSRITQQRRLFLKDTWLTPNFAISNESVVGGELIKNIKALGRGNIPLGQHANVDVDVLVPCDKTITEATNAQFKLNCKEYFVAGSLTLDKINQPTIKAGYQDGSLSVIIENTGEKRENWDVLVTKNVDVNTIVGMHSNPKTGDFSIASEIVLSDNTEIKLGLSNADVLDLTLTKQFPHVTASLAMRANGLIQTGQASDLKFGVGIELDL